MKPLRLYLFMGYPGAGKTTVARIIEEATGAVHLWVDRERRKMFGISTHSEHESSHLYSYLNELTGQLLAEGKSVIFDTNFNYARDRQHLQSIAAAQGAETVVIWIITPKEIARKRATDRSHRDRNGYDDIMSAADFDRLSNHLQAPGKDENIIKIDGTKVDQAALKRQFSQ